MLPLPLTLAKARRLWHQDFESQCERNPLQLRTRAHKARTLKDGTLVPARTERYHVQPKVAPSTAKDTMSDLILMGIRALEAQNRELDFDFTQGGKDAPSVPPISVNCKMLGKRRTLSSRTLRTHIDLLLKMGAIVRKAWHGTRANFELWINPKYLWQTPEMPVESDLDRLQIGSILQGEPTKFPLSVAFETLETRKLDIREVDKLLPHEASATKTEIVVATTPVSGLETLATPTRNTGPQADPELAAHASEIASAGPRHESRATARKKAVAAPAGPDMTSRRVHKEFVMSLWAYARQELYANVAFDEQQHAKAQNAIWYGVFGGFNGSLTEREYGLYHQQCLARVDLVAKWLKRNSAYHLPMPYAEVVKGRGYFDKENTEGFVKTQKWLADKLERYHDFNVATVLRRAGAEMRGWRLKTASKRVMALTAAQLYHKHLKKVQALRDPRALDKFYIVAAGGKS